jgi:hypothetical protein
VEQESAIYLKAIRVQFNKTNAVDTATLVAPNFLNFGNGNRLRRTGDIPPPPEPPQCFC